MALKTAPTEKTIIRSPIGPIEIVCIGDYVCSVNFINADEVAKGEKTATTGTMQACISQLDEYFSGARKIFDLKLSPGGTEFQQRVWNELLKIPFGRTVAYGDIAVKLGDKKAVRAVGTANGSNPIAIIIPCHRVIGQNGTLTGYAGGLQRKQWLLNHESPQIQTSLFK